MSNRTQNCASMLLSAATPASGTATHGDTEAAIVRRPFTSSVLLVNFARTLWFGRIRQPSEQMRLGLGGDSAESLSDWDTPFSLSDFAPVALGLTTLGIDCSCLPHYRTPTARDWKGQSAKSWRERTKGDTTPTLPDQIGGVPHPEFVEALMGFPIGWTDLGASATASSRKSRSGSSGGSSKRTARRKAQKPAPADEPSTPERQ
jgi:hypothetical protein